eukprot:3620282-Amphidinium_carterae.2
MTQKLQQNRRKFKCVINTPQASTTAISRKQTWRQQRLQKVIAKSRLAILGSGTQTAICGHCRWDELPVFRLPSATGLLTHIHDLVAPPPPLSFRSSLQSDGSWIGVPVHVKLVSLEQHRPHRVSQVTYGIRYSIVLATMGRLQAVPEESWAELKALGCPVVRVQQQGKRLRAVELPFEIWTGENEDVVLEDVNMKSCSPKVDGQLNAHTAWSFLQRLDQDVFCTKHMHHRPGVGFAGAFSQSLGQWGVTHYVVSSQSPWEKGRAERAGKRLKEQSVRRASAVRRLAMGAYTLLHARRQLFRVSRAKSRSPYASTEVHPGMHVYMWRQGQLGKRGCHGPGVAVAARSAQGLIEKFVRSLKTKPGRAGMRRYVDCTREAQHIDEVSTDAECEDVPGEMAD